MAQQAEAVNSALELISDPKAHAFTIPRKMINEGQDMSSFLTSKAYRDILTLIMQLNHAMFPHLIDGPEEGKDIVKTFEINNPRQRFSPVIVHLQELLSVLDGLNDEVGLDTGLRRFGNISFRKWCSLVEDRAIELLQMHLSPSAIPLEQGDISGFYEEAKAYLLGSFGSSQRLDYGTGHELSFLAFLGCIYKIGGFGSAPTENDMREIVIGVLQPYLVLARKLILRYTLEPAGSHGVWGLDDHSFLPYIFGSAQYGPPIRSRDPIPTEGSLKGATDPGNVAKAQIVEQERSRNFYFGAIGFIYDVKKGPFWEHSPTLYDISGVRAGWGKINKGMLKMYDAEVLGKFPVVQHFPFGSLFRFERDTDAKMPNATAHMASQPVRQMQGPPVPSQSHPNTVNAPWANAQPSSFHTATNLTQAPWASRQPPPTAIARDRNAPSQPVRNTNPAVVGSAGDKMPPLTKAPWAK